MSKNHKILHTYKSKLKKLKAENRLYIKSTLEQVLASYPKIKKMDFYFDPSEGVLDIQGINGEVFDTSLFADQESRVFLNSRITHLMSCESFKSFLIEYELSKEILCDFYFDMNEVLMGAKLLGCEGIVNKLILELLPGSVDIT